MSLKSAIVACLVGAAAAGSATIKNCGDSSYVVDFGTFDVSPSNVQKGAPVQLTCNGTSTSAISDATYTLSVSLGGVPLYNHQGNGCGQDTVSLPAGAGTLVLDGLACPLSAGEASVAIDVTLPSFVPSGSYTIKQTASNGGKNIYCFEADLKL